MKNLTIATDLKDDSTNVEVGSVEELNKFVKFYGSKFFYIYVPGFHWLTLDEFCLLNNIEDLF